MCLVLVQTPLHSAVVLCWRAEWHYPPWPPCSPWSQSRLRFVAQRILKRACLHEDLFVDIYVHCTVLKGVVGFFFLGGGRRGMGTVQLLACASATCPFNAAAAVAFCKNTQYSTRIHTGYTGKSSRGGGQVKAAVWGCRRGTTGRQPAVLHPPCWASNWSLRDRAGRGRQEQEMLLWVSTLGWVAVGRKKSTAKGRSSWQ